MDGTTEPSYDMHRAYVQLLDKGMLPIASIKIT